MKKSYIILGIASLLGIVWYLSRNANKKSFVIVNSKQARATYIGPDNFLGTNDILTAGERVTGKLNNDGSLVMQYMTSYGSHSLTIPANQLKDIEELF